MYMLLNVVHFQKSDTPPSGWIRKACNFQWNKSSLFLDGWFFHQQISGFQELQTDPTFSSGKKPAGSMQIVFREGLKQKSGQVWALGMSNLLGEKNLSQPPQNIRPTTVTIFLRSISGSQIPSGSSFERRPFSLVMVILFDLGMLHNCLSLPQASREMLHWILWGYYKAQKLPHKLHNCH